MKNPFKFGSVVEGKYFTNRVEEINKVKSILNSKNHLVLISPRRYGKTSLIKKVVKPINRPLIMIDLQVITGQADLASQLLRRVYSIYPWQKLKGLIKNFRISPTINIDPVTNSIDVSYRLHSVSNEKTAIEDVLNLIDKLGKSKNKPIVVFDEFQEITSIGTNTDKILRSVMQHHQNVNYVFLGSRESMIREIFEKKKSPFYHFAILFPLEKIEPQEFRKFLHSKFRSVSDEYSKISDAILSITKSHPYFTQQLSFKTWELLFLNNNVIEPVAKSVDELIKIHDIDYERLWNTLITTDKKVLIGMSLSNLAPLSNQFAVEFNTGATSTIYSSVKRLSNNGFIVKSDTGYEIDDPFFKRWIIIKRMGN